MYADVIMDITSERLDKSFQYVVPPQLESQVIPGSVVLVPFGARKEVKGYVLRLSSHAVFDPQKTKPISAVIHQRLSVDDQLMGLAVAIQARYGGTLVQSIRTVMPVKKRMQGPNMKTYQLGIPHDAFLSVLEQTAGNKTLAPRHRVLSCFSSQPLWEHQALLQAANVKEGTLSAMLDKGLLVLDKERVFRSVLPEKGEELPAHFTPEQTSVFQKLKNWMEEDGPVRALLHGITGSGKTLLYTALAREAVRKGQQVIVLIPEIALSYQTVSRFQGEFGQRIAILHSRLSQGERYDQFVQILEGGVDIVIGPRTALFAPFSRLGLIIVDEEQEDSYLNENTPRYDAREVALMRAEAVGAHVLYGSATPSVETFYCTTLPKGHPDYMPKFSLQQRAVPASHISRVEIVDLRQEFQEGNRSIFSRTLKEAMSLRFERGEQVMLFLNRRGLSGGLCCRSCGKTIRCRHCDVSMTAHKDQRLRCHYCGYSIPIPAKCPHCGSPYLAPFGSGTQKVELLAQKAFPGIVSARMDGDTTRQKDSYKKILGDFQSGKIQLLIGTQMIVKGHDYPGVTLVGVLLADLSLLNHEYRSAEKTFQLLTQAAGRSGRGAIPGETIIQTYQPDHYAITCAAAQDYETFFLREMRFRRLMHYPPAGAMLEILCTGPEETMAWEQAQKGAREVQACFPKSVVIGPAQDVRFRLQDQFRFLFYVKAGREDEVISIRQHLENLFSGCKKEGFMVQFQLG